MNTDLTQVLNDGLYFYAYGMGRISQQQGIMPEYFLGDTLGSVRQLTDQAGVVVLSRSYDPYGNVAQTSGTSTTAYGYTGEQQDVASGLIYLRARYYESEIGRFIEKDPAKLEANLYTYSRSNPTNYIDPSGQFSKDLINKNIPVADFSNIPSPNNKWNDKEHWGFYALLLNAQNFDWIRVGSLNLFHLYPDVSWSKEDKIWETNCETIMVGSQPLRQYFENTVKPQKFPGIWWRDTSASFYDLYTSIAPRSFADGLNYGLNSDYPQYRSISIGLGEKPEVNIIVDINGQLHLSVSPAFGVTYGLGYTEGYLGNLFSPGAPSMSDVTKAVDGLCFFGGIILVGGESGSVCPSLSSLINPTAITGVDTYYLGLEAGVTVGGISVTFPLPYSNPAMGWRWAMQDQINGITYGDVLP